MAETRGNSQTGDSIDTYSGVASQSITFDKSLSELRITKDDVRAQLLEMGYEEDALPDDIMEEFIEELKHLYRTELVDFLESEIEGYNASDSDGAEDFEGDIADDGVHNLHRRGHWTDQEFVDRDHTAFSERDEGGSRHDVQLQGVPPDGYSRPMGDISNIVPRPSLSPPAQARTISPSLQPIPKPATLTEPPSELTERDAHAEASDDNHQSLASRLASIDLSRARKKVAEQQRLQNHVAFEDASPEDQIRRNDDGYEEREYSHHEDGTDKFSNFDYDLSEFDEFAASLDEGEHDFDESFDDSRASSARTITSASRTGCK
ncbi:hypothetical protein HK097_010935 [Rhizophlyctis rosea]|uniref:Uncharacterized protein n=1 Tax=Rhizophlyctis rosea TaxID=64517 RepID=A0AAD5S710_9FUNG|nr:hypothetical protein HK097_010935 [Rhizophlyctis rosea]